MANVIICSAAEVDFTESLKWYAERSIDAANDFDAERLPMCDERHRYFLLRRFPFRIIYRIANFDILIIAVAHGSRSPDYWMNR